jgi:uncharacterized protein YbjQ (UPF0145 family)
MKNCVQSVDRMNEPHPLNENRTHPLTTTAFDLAGYRVVRSLGVVRGIIVRSRSIVGTIGAQLQSLVGGNISLYTSLCERARDDAFRGMLEHASRLGANAVIGIRYDATEVGQGITEVICYGTAVFVEVSAEKGRSAGPGGEVV